MFQFTAGLSEVNNVHRRYLFSQVQEQLTHRVTSPVSHYF